MHVAVAFVLVLRETINAYYYSYTQSKSLYEPMNLPTIHLSWQ